jgi:hypothetical protein
MKTISNLAISASRPKKVALAMALGGVLLTALTMPVHAYDRDWRGHEQNNHRYWNRARYGGEPGVIYAPPVVYQAPQYEEPGINLIVPLNIR